MTQLAFEIKKRPSECQTLYLVLRTENLQNENITRITLSITIIFRMVSVSSSRIESTAILVSGTAVSRCPNTTPGICLSPAVCRSREEPSRGCQAPCQPILCLVCFLCLPVSQDVDSHRADLSVNLTSASYSLCDFGQGTSPVGLSKFRTTGITSPLSEGFWENSVT